MNEPQRIQGSKPDRTSDEWWKRSIIYQIYPRSFQDSNGDGIGDLAGITSRLDYIAELGVDLVWLGPICKSPNADMGYDVSDYTDIMDEFGTMAEFDELLAEADKRGIGLIVDLVVNHSSDEHAWFQDARTAVDSSHRDFYIWRKAQDGPPNNWQSLFGGSAWRLDETTDEYFLHLFAAQQPDLNWDNPALRDEVYSTMRFWLEKGVAGFRLDVVSFFSKDAELPNAPDDTEDWLAWYANGPNIHTYLQEMHTEVLSHFDVVTIGEAPGVTAEEAPKYVAPERRELDMVFLFDLMQLDRHPAHFDQKVAWSVADIKRVLATWEQSLGDDGWNSLYFGNHDFPRMVSRFGCDGPCHVASAKMLATLQFTLRGTPFIYNGDEIGMTDVRFDDIGDYRDISTINSYAAARDRGMDRQDALAKVAATSRDNARTPMQWDAGPNAGFTDSNEPWIGTNPNFRKINVAVAQTDPDSILHYYRRLVELRRKHSALIQGSLEFHETPSDSMISYSRKLGGEIIRVWLNFSTKNHGLDLNRWHPDGKSIVLINNYPLNNELPTTMRPYEAIVLKTQ